MIGRSLLMRCCLLAAIACLVVTRSQAADPIDLRILYCGDIGSPREADFRKFLGEHFAKVTVCGLGQFTEEKSQDHDVVIFDWTSTCDDDGIPDFEQNDRLRNNAPHLSPTYSRPTILIAEAGGRVSLFSKLKTDWLCLCLTGSAHKLALGHQLFHMPLAVDPELEEIPTPAGYTEITIDESLGPAMKTWLVQSKDYKPVGLVSNLYGFLDSPETEVFAQGIAWKGPDTVALARQANFFMWGFSASPAQMSPAAQRLFINAACYIQTFDGDVPLVRNVSSSREWALRYAATARKMSEETRARESREYRENWSKLLAKNPALLPAEYKGDADGYVEMRLQRMLQAKESSMETLLPQSLRTAYCSDADKYMAFYKENFEYLRPEGGDSMLFVVDEDAKGIGPSNRKVELLDRCIAMLERDDRPDLALRLLQRYTDAKCDSPAQWRAWLAANRGRLFFSDVGGYKFFVGPARARQSSGDKPTSATAPPARRAGGE
jgi:hypothetical protein